LPGTGLAHILQTPSKLVVPGQLVEILFKAEHGEDSGQHSEAGRQIPPLEASERVARHVDPSGKVVERHAAPQASKTQSFAERLGTALGLRE
jgi:hypothetical protein